MAAAALVHVGNDVGNVLHLGAVDADLGRNRQFVLATVDREDADDLERALEALRDVLRATRSAAAAGT